jgi:hypothetical protein
MTTTDLPAFLTNTLPSLGVDASIYASFLTEIFASSSSAPAAAARPSTSTLHSVIINGDEDGDIQTQLDEAAECLTGATGETPPDAFMQELAVVAKAWLRERAARQHVQAQAEVDTKRALDQVLQRERDAMMLSSSARRQPGGGGGPASHLSPEERAVIMRFQNETVFSSDEEGDDDGEDQDVGGGASIKPSSSSSTNKKHIANTTITAAFDSVFTSSSAAAAGVEVGANGNREAVKDRLAQENKARLEKQQTHVAKSKAASQQDRETKDAKKNERREKAVKGERKR